jgi:hypothetical protein
MSTKRYKKVAAEYEPGCLNRAQRLHREADSLVGSEVYKNLWRNRPYRVLSVSPGWNYENCTLNVMDEVNGVQDVIPFGNHVI